MKGETTSKEHNSAHADLAHETEALATAIILLFGSLDPEDQESRSLKRKKRKDPMPISTFLVWTSFFG